MNWIKVAWEKSVKDSSMKRKQRQFALLIIVLLGLFYWRQWDYLVLTMHPFYLIAAYPLIGLVIPIILKPTLLIWLLIGNIMAEISSFILLFLMYYLLALPIKFFLKSKPEPGWTMQDKVESDYKNLY
jgi:hypothetical protein